MDSLADVGSKFAHTLNFYGTIVKIWVWNCMSMNSHLNQKLYDIKLEIITDLESLKEIWLMAKKETECIYKTRPKIQDWNQFEWKSNFEYKTQTDVECETDIK